MRDCWFWLEKIENLVKIDSLAMAYGEYSVSHNELENGLEQCQCQLYGISVGPTEGKLNL